MPECLSKNLDEIYKDTKYRILPFKYDILVERGHLWLDMWMSINDIQTYAIITAWNPKSVEVSALRNSVKNQQLLKDILKNSGLIFPVLGIGSDANWRAEASWFITNTPKASCLTLARSYDQNAIVFGYINQKAQLLYT